MQMARKGQGIGIVEGLQGGFGGEDFLRELMQRTMQQVLEAEMTSFLGAETYERNGERRGWRNGYNRLRKNSSVFCWANFLPHRISL